MARLRIFVRAFLTRGNWKHSHRTNRSVGDIDRMWMGAAYIIEGLAMLATLGRVTCWADISISLKFACLDEHGNRRIPGKTDDD